MAERYPLPVYYDFASTICYVAHRVLGRLSARIDEIGVDLEWRPIDLTAVTGWRRGARVAGAGRERALRIARELEVPVRMPGFWIDSRPASCRALALHGAPVKAAVWRERVWTAVYEEGRDVGAPGEIERLWFDLGLDAQETTSYGEIERATLDARKAGVQGVPTFLVDTWPMGGIQDDFAMIAFFERFARKRRRERER